MPYPCLAVFDKSVQMPPTVNSRRDIVVIGSINMDLVCRTPRMPAGGETIVGSDFVTISGGKGANQAVAAMKLVRDETQVHLVGRIGSDDFGQRLLNSLTQYGVQTQYVTITEGVASGVAMILVDKRGENSIVVAPGVSTTPSSQAGCSTCCASAEAISTFAA